MGEEVAETFFRSVHSLKSSSQFIGASALADLCLKLEIECKKNEVCSGSLLSLSLQVRKYAKELDGQVTGYLSMQ
jgi:HPt (histidine-containing phosphotransfer) domain-containing protein